MNYNTQNAKIASITEKTLIKRNEEEISKSGNAALEKMYATHAHPHNCDLLIRILCYNLIKIRKK